MDPKFFARTSVLVFDQKIMVQVQVQATEEPRGGVACPWSLRGAEQGALMAISRVQGARAQGLKCMFKASPSQGIC